MLPFTPAVVAIAAACLALAPATRCAHTSGLGTPAITIAILDTGIAPLQWLAPNLTHGYDFVAATPATDDLNGHGTAMASIADGVCSQCTIVPVRVAGGAGIGTAAIAAAGIRWTVAHGVRVVNFSLTSGAEDPELTLAIADATSHGVIVVLAAGNGGSADPVGNGYPAAANPEAITVGGADPSGHLYPWSNHGSWVEFAAPGSAKALTVAGKTFEAEGTSVAAAFVSGVVGLMLSANPSLTPRRVNEILVATGTPEPGLDVGSGRLLDLPAAVAAARVG
jgi:subtilisin family serine protease